MCVTNRHDLWLPQTRTAKLVYYAVQPAAVQKNNWWTQISCLNCENQMNGD